MTKKEIIKVLVCFVLLVVTSTMLASAFALTDSITSVSGTSARSANEMISALQADQEVKFNGTAIEYFSSTGTCSWKVRVDTIVSGPSELQGHTVTVALWTGGSDEFPSGSLDPEIEPGDKVGVYGLYVGDDYVTLSGSKEYYINVIAAGNPTANFDYAPTDIFANQKVTFDASTSYDPDGAITKYDWDFGDGTKGTGVIVTHSYTAPGKYNVVLTVTDDAGLTNSKSEEITVEETENAIYVPDEYSTIQQAVDAAESGETIMVRAGSYTENVVVNKPHLTVRSENGAGATIVQAANSNSKDHVFEVTADCVTINGFTVKGATENPNAGICLHYVDYCNISGNNVSNNYYGIYIYRGCSAVTNEGTMQLTSSPLWQANPIWSPDGTKILYTTGGYEIYKPPDIWVMNADGSNKIQLTTDPTPQALASWNRDGTKIVYASDQSGSRDIWVMNADGSNKIQLTTDPKAEAHPSWSPDGTKIIYETASGSYETHNVDIWIMNADGTGKTQLTSDAKIERSYSLSRTGKIAYEKYMGDHNWDIWLMDLDGSNKRQLTTDISQETDPLISPDGSKIAYNKFTGSKWLEIWVMDSDGSNKKRLSTGAVRVREASWSPDGTKLAFGDGVPYQIFVINADGTMKTQLTTGAYYNLQPIWSPDSEKIAYVSAKSTDLSGEANIWLMTLGGSNYSSNNRLYMNNFMDNTDNTHSELSTNLWNSTSKITYTYNGNTYTNYLGNYWDDYSGHDANGDGIGDTPYSINSDKDNYPLMQPWEKYFEAHGGINIARRGNGRAVFNSYL